MEEARRFTSADSDNAVAASQRPVSAQHRSGAHGHHASRHELRRQISSLRTQRLVLSAASGVLLVVCLALALTARQVWSSRNEVQQTLAEEREALQTRLQEVQTDLDATRKALKTAYASIGALTEKRIPDLVEIAFDQAINVNQDPIRNISFNPVRGSDRNTYELKVVMENASPVPVSPSAIIRLFDRTGVEVGRSKIGPAAGGDPLTLRPGEIRSHFAAIELDPGYDAHYFRLEPAGP